jgi:ribose/xylose/arabinose/galactoside ABC-type transport system permease subunit
MRAVLCTGIVSLSACSAGLLDWFGINSSCFIFLYVVVLVSLILNYTTAMRRLRVMGQGVLTDHTSMGYRQVIPGTPSHI